VNIGSRPNQSMFSNRKNIIISIVVLAVIALALYFIVGAMRKRDEASMTPATPLPIRNELQNQEEGSLYKDGMYTAIGSYTSPGGPEEVGVTLTLRSGIIIDSFFTPRAELPISVNMQKVFSENYKQFVVGKSIRELKLSKVSTSSLTPIGFNDALDKIRVQAKS
jgi:hypothetical protein